MLDIHIEHLSFEMDWQFAKPALGIDPGQVHMGVAVIDRFQADLYEIEMESESDSIARIMRVTTCMNFLLDRYKAVFCGAVVEGAAHMAPYGQVPLETVRTTAAIAAMQHGIWPVAVVPPKVVRLSIFGNGLYRAQEVWPTYPENAATALACALYAGRGARM